MIICLCITLLFGCTSEPLSVRYYLLHTPANKVVNKDNKAKPVVAVQLPIIAEYLRQPSLVMQVDQHQLHYSHQDVWAEKLQSSFFKALLQDLNTTGKRNYVSSSSPEAISAVTTISIKLEHFHATDASTVVSSGWYWLSKNEMQHPKNTDLENSSHGFYFESDLEQDGFAHAVIKLRTLIGDLAKQIEKDITALP